MLVRVIVAVDDPELRTRVCRGLPEVEVHVLLAAARGAAEEALARSTYDLAVVSAVKADASLAAVIRAAAHLPDRPQIVALLDQDSADARARLLADGVLVLDTSLDDALLASTLGTLVAQRRDETQRRLTRPRPSARTLELVLASEAMREVANTAERVARSESAVLLLGETGVGKERIAESIHRASGRSHGPFIAVNCAAIPSELFESELFGHEKGAFTGAVRARRGQFELAHEGTLFLDEVGEVPLHLQPKLLRALQEHRIRPLGGEAGVEVDVRVIAATNRDLATEMAAGHFRRDLYYRLGVVELTIPPLRERPDDVEALASAYLVYYREQMGREVSGFDDDALDALRRYAWPGNVRELVNVIERAVLLCEAERIRLGDLPSSVAASTTLVEPALAEDAAGLEAMTTDQLDGVIRLPPRWREEPWKIVREGVLLAGERAYLTAILQLSAGRVGDAAKRAGISPRALFEKMRRHGLRKEDFRD